MRGDAAKRDHIAEFPTEDLFMLLLDTDFRNRIGHHAAHYEQEHDAIVTFDTKDAGSVSLVVVTPNSVRNCLDLVAAFKLAAICHHDLHIFLSGRFVKLPVI